jgi:hypothetical protein
MSAETYGGGERGVERHGASQPFPFSGIRPAGERRVRSFPLPRVAGSVWVRHASRMVAHAPEKCGTRFSDKAYAPTHCAAKPAMPEGG